MKIKIIGIIYFLINFCFVSFPQQITQKEISDGIFYKQIIDSKNKLIINILKIDLTNPSYEIEAVKANNKLAGKETTSGLSSRLSDSGLSIPRGKVIAGINADFWETDGEIINNMISSGKIVKAVSSPAYDSKKFIYSQFALTENNKPSIEQFNFNGKIFWKDNSFDKINRVNSKTDSSGLTIYNLYQGDFTPGSSKNFKITEAVLTPVGFSGDTLFYKFYGNIFNEGLNAIPKTAVILSASAGKANYIKTKISKYDTVKILYEFIPKFDNIYTLTGGLPQIVKDGRNISQITNSTEGVNQKFSETLHPRTGIGFSKDSTTLYFFTVDGRQKSSVGISLDNFADLMISEGVYQGLNLDGGGSTTMVINGKVVNNPSDYSGERPVGSCLFVIRKN